MTLDLDQVEEVLFEQGWVVIDLPEPAPVLVTRGALVAHLHEVGLDGIERLEDYHQHVGDHRHIDVWHDLAEWFWEADLSRQIAEANLDLFRRLIGPDIHIQRYPYLRVVRPGKSQDAAPLHRDTYYGSSPWELVLLVPFTDAPADGALRVISGSHLAPDTDYPYTQHEAPDVPVRSKKHRLGYSYAPRLLGAEHTARAEPVPVAVGQALLFVLSLVHGAGTNASPHTRFSADIRLVSSLAGVSYERGVHDDYYVPLVSSALARAAATYRAANGQT